MVDIAVLKDGVEAKKLEIMHFVQTKKDARPA